MKYIKWLWHRAGDAKGSVTWNILLACISIGLNLFFIWLSKSLVDIATGARTGSTLKLFAAILIATMLVRVFVNAARARLESNSVYKMQFIIRKDLFEGLIREQWNGKERFHSGDAVSRLFTDVDVVSKVICQDLPALIITIIQLAAAFVFLCTMDAKLAIILLLITPAFAAFGKIFFRRMRKLTKDIRESESNVQSHIQETLQHKTVVQSMGQELSMEEKLGGLQDTEYDQVLRRTKFNVFSRTAVSIAFGLGYSAAMLWGVFGIWQGAITFGVMTAFLQLVGQIQGPSMQLTRQIPSLIYAAASMDRLMEIENSEKEESGEQIMLEAPAGISVDHISFRYPDGKGWIFHDFSYDFKPGSRTAIVGETGIGKSTLIRLILSLLKPNGGEIRIYNESESRITSALTRNNLVYVPQGNTLFSGTVRENLLMGDPGADDRQMWAVLDVAEAGFVRNLPGGLDARIGEIGAGLSEGQAQRIAIARGLLRPGSILLLDEFSSSLDLETERRLLKNLSENYGNKTIIFITHRDAVLDYCDSVLRL